MKKIRTNKGLTLLEIIISLAIVSIMIVPISNMLRMSISMNKKNDINQDVTLLGQEIIEEIDSISSISKDEINLSNMTLKANKFNDESSLEYSMDDYGKDKLDIDIILKQNTDLDYDYEYNYDNLDVGLNGNLKVTANSNNINIEDVINDKFIASFNNAEEIAMGIKLIKEDNKIVLIVNEDVNNKLIMSEDKDITNLKLMMNLSKEYKNNNTLKLEVTNQTGIPMELLIKKSYDAIGDIDIDNKFGKLTIYNNLRDMEEIDLSKVDNLYNLNIIIKNKDNILFEGNINKNLKILN